MATKQINFNGHQQRGVALFISLVVLLIITIVGVSAVQTTTLEERMAANARDRDIAFQAAEAALISAENFIEGLEPADIPGFLGNASGLYVPATPGDVARWDEVDWEGDASLPQTDDDLPGVYQQPRYIVEHLTQIAPDEDELNLSNIGGATGAATDVFRITARGQGGSQYAEVMLQSSYGKVL